MSSETKTPPALFKTFEELSPEHQKQAIEYEVEYVLTGLVEGFEERGDDNFWERIEEAENEMERLKTPWFLGGRIMETCADDIASWARDDAESAVYPHNSVYVSHVLFIESDDDV